MNTKNIMLAIWNQLTRKVAWRNIFVTHNAFGIFSQYSQKKGDYLKAKKEKSCKSKIYRTLLRRERDSNPRYLSVRRFSRPVHSTTLPSLHRVLDPIDIVLLYVATRYVVLLICGCKGSSFYLICKTFRHFFLKNMKKRT